MIPDPCTRYGIMSGCDEDCPVLNDGDCTIEEELALETDWYAEWAVAAGYERGLLILEEVASSREISKSVECINDFDRAMELLK